MATATAYLYEETLTNGDTHERILIDILKPVRLRVYPSIDRALASADGRLAQLLGLTFQEVGPAVCREEAWVEAKDGCRHRNAKIIAIGGYLGTYAARIFQSIKLVDFIDQEN